MSVPVQPLPLPELVALVNDWGTLPRRVGHRSAPPDGRGSADTIALADRVHDVFTADTAERVRLVNAMLAEVAVRPEMAYEDGVPAAAWSVPEPAAARAASAALALREHMAAQPERMGVCADRQCADVYVDASPAGHRRFCSVTCQNRTRVAAFRARRRAT